MRGADDDDVPRDDRRGMQADVGRHQIHRLIVVQLQIDDAVVAETSRRAPGLRVERDQAIAGSDVEDSRLVAVGPVGEAASGQPPRRGVAARAFVLAVHPQHLAGGGVERHDRAPRARGGEYSTPPTISGVDWKLNSGRGPSGSVLKRQATSSLLKFAGGDLVERGIARAGEIAAVSAPLAPLCAGLPGRASRCDATIPTRKDQQRDTKTTRSRHHEWPL